MRLILVSVLFFSAMTSWAQLMPVPIVRQAAHSKKINYSARVQSLSAMPLPFWDDFSFNNPSHKDLLANYPSDSLWQFGHSVWVNTGMGINPPTLKVATFDGIDSLGKPYSINNAYAKGIADRLTSRPLRMDLIPVNRQDSVFIFFYYQYQGNGEPPDAGDELSLWFKNDSGTWIKVWSVGESSTSDNTIFVPVKLFVGDSHYFYNGFQFRFQNYGRLSGPFDTWNLDYIYVSNGLDQYAPHYSNFPDRAIATTMSSVFTQYQSIPVKHFLANPDAHIVSPSFVVTNQRSDLQQPVDFDANLTTTVRQNKVVTKTTVPFYSSPALAVVFGQPQLFAFNSAYSFNGLNPSIDSIALKFDIQINTKDNIKKINSSSGDYDTVVYKGIEFRYNDTTSTNFILKDYYAYDDGAAEYAVTLTQPGISLAYEFDMLYAQPDTLVAVDIYFPHVGDESNQVVNLKVWDKLAPKARDSLQLTIKRTENNKFIRVPLIQALLVQNKFFIGWRQNSNATIGVGFDKDSDSGSKIFYNTTGTWLQSTDLHGNLMIRPVFGKGNLNVTTAVEEIKTLAYPNPNRGVFYLPSSVQQLEVVNMTGQRVSFAQEGSFEQTQVTLSNPFPGLYLTRYFDGTQWRTEKIMVQP